VPRAAGWFQDREVAAGLREAAEQDGTVVLTQVLAGMGGTGKTQLAAAYARWAWREGAGLLVWVNAVSRDAIVAAYADATLALGLPGADPRDPERSAQAFLAWAETTTSCWWLVVLDDVQQPGDLTGLWPPAAESAAGGQVLVTTRLREAAFVGTGRRTVQVPVFSSAEACSYLQKQLGDRATREQAEELARALGMLPLALAQAAAYIRDADITIGRYLELLATRRLRDVVPEPGHLTDDHQRIITATWELSVDRASRARPAGLARPLLQLASVLDPAGIPQTVLNSPPALDYLSGYLPEPAQSRQVSADMVDEALRVLHRHSLIDHDRAAAYREVRVHQLVQRATRDNLAAQPGLGPDLYAALTETAADALLAVWPEIERDGLGQIRRANASALIQVASTSPWDPGTRDLSRQLRAGTDAAGRHASEPLWTPGGYHVLLAVTGTSLGSAGQVAGAAAYFERLHAQAVQRLGPDHRYTLAALGNQAVWLAEGGDAAGVTIARQLVDARQRTLGPRHPDTLTARHTLAHARHKAGDLEDAAADLESLLADRMVILGADHPDTLTTRHNLARSRGDLALRRGADLAGVVAEYAKILTDTRRILGNDHPDTLSARHELALWRSLAGDPDRAAAEFAQLSVDRVRVLGADHPHTLKTRNELAAATGRAGDPVAARAEFTSVLAERLRVLGPDHPDTLNTRLHLIDVSADAGPAAPAAIAELEALLGDILRVLGPDHRDAWNACVMIALLRDADADPRVSVSDELLAACLRDLDPDHPSVWRARARVVAARTEAGDIAGTVTALDGLATDLTRLNGPDHPETLGVRAALALWRIDAGDPTGAAADYAKLLADLLLVHGPDHREVFAVRANIAGLRGVDGDAPSAVVAYVELLADQARVLGPDHPDTLTARGNLANWRGEAGDAAGAAAAFEELLPEFLRVLGSDHAATVTARASLAGWRERAGLGASPAQASSAAPPGGHFSATSCLSRLFRSSQYMLLGRRCWYRR
jgi:hypothetical protein